jgi:hypothetical protein
MMLVHHRASAGGTSTSQLQTTPIAPALDTTALQPGGVQEDLLYFGAKLLNPSTIFSTHLNI